MTVELSWLKQPFAHRGLHDAAVGRIENTAGAVSAALALGFGVEVDLQLAACGTAMVFHDAELSRLTFARGALSAHSCHDLQSLEFRGSNERMLTLGELLSLVDDRAPLLLELKADPNRGEQFVRVVVEATSTYNGRFAVMSFDPWLVSQLRLIAPDIPRGLVSERYLNHQHWQGLTATQRLLRRHLLSAWKSRPDFIAYDIDALPAFGPFVARRMFGLPLLTWTVRSQAQQELAHRHADAIIFEGFVPSTESAI